MNNIFEQHKKWINIALTFGAGDYAEDLVQDTYIKVHNLKEINEAYFYFALRSTIVDYHRKNKKKIEIVEELEYEEITMPDEIYNYIDTWEHYDRKLYLLYINSNMTMRQMAKETHISLTSIFNTINNCNKKLKVWLQQNQ